MRALLSKAKVLSALRLLGRGVGRGAHGDKIYYCRADYNSIYIVYVYGCERFAVIPYEGIISAADSGVYYFRLSADKIDCVTKGEDRIIYLDIDSEEFCFGGCRGFSDSTPDSVVEKEFISSRYELGVEGAEAFILASKIIEYNDTRSLMGYMSIKMSNGVACIEAANERVGFVWRGNISNKDNHSLLVNYHGVKYIGSCKSAKSSLLIEVSETSNYIQIGHFGVIHPHDGGYPDLFGLLDRDYRGRCGVEVKDKHIYIDDKDTGVRLPYSTAVVLKNIIPSGGVSGERYGDIIHVQRGGYNFLLDVT